MADIEMTAQPSNKPHISKRDIIKFKPERDSANDIRNALLVASALIAAATFAAEWTLREGFGKIMQTIMLPANQF